MKTLETEPHPTNFISQTHQHRSIVYTPNSACNINGIILWDYHQILIYNTFLQYQYFASEMSLFWKNFTQPLKYPVSLSYSLNHIIMKSWTIAVTAVAENFESVVFWNFRPFEIIFMVFCNYLFYFWKWSFGKLIGSILN